MVKMKEQGDAINEKGHNDDMVKMKEQVEKSHDDMVKKKIVKNYLKLQVNLGTNASMSPPGAAVP